jgi:hypothetical protein
MRYVMCCRMCYALVLATLLFLGCARAPVFDIAGSLFPSWLVCMILGILLAVLARALILRLQISIIFPIFAYPSLAALFTFLLWLIFFS